VDEAIVKNINYAGYTDRIRSVQTRHLNNLLNFERIGRLIDHSALDTKNYSALEMLRDLRLGLWSETKTASNVMVYRRNLQRAYLDRMTYLMTKELDARRSRQYFNVNQSDVRALVRGELNQLQRALKAVSKMALNTETRYHYSDCIERIKRVLDPK